MSSGVGDRAASFVLLWALLVLWGPLASCDGEVTPGEVTPAEIPTPSRLTDNAVDDGEPAWSPDGRRVAFQHRGFGIDPEIYVMNADGSGQTRLTNNQVFDASPVWSPEGDKIAFASCRFRNGEGCFEEIYVMNPDGSEQTNLTKKLPNDAEDLAWSPDGEKIAFAHHQEYGTTDYDIYVMNSDGSALTNLSDNPDWEADPHWSPDGKTIIYECYSVTLCMMNADGTNKALLRTGVTGSSKFSASNPTWSPDGEKIAFYREGPNLVYTHLYLIRPDRTINLSNHSASQEIVSSLAEISWSPDGQKIAFVSDNTGDQEVYMMNAEGSGVQRLTDDPLDDLGPVWAPDGSKIAFESTRDGHDSEIYVVDVEQEGD